MSIRSPSGRVPTAALATVAAVGLLLAALPGGASPRPADNRLTSSSGVVIFAVITRDANLGTDANAVAIHNTSTTSVANLDGWSVTVKDSSEATTASYTFTTTTLLLPWQQVVISGPGYTPTPLTSHAIHRKFSSGGGDLIPDNFQATLDNGSGAEDIVATSGSMSPEGGNPAPAPNSATDLCEAAVRRDQSGDDTNDNADDFSLAPVLVWGTTIALTC